PSVVPVPEPPAAEPVAASVPEPPVAEPVAVSVPEPPAGDEIVAAILEIVAAQTGYPADMLEPGLDLEADLGIDTVKQAEMFAAIRERYGIERDDTLKLRDYPTLRHVAGFVEERITTVPAPVVEERITTVPAPVVED